MARLRASILALGVVLAAPASADPWDQPALRDDGPETLSELAHGSDEVHDLRASAGKPDEDWFRIRQEPFASYEIVVDGAVGDVTPISLELVAADGSTVLATSVAVGTGAVRSLRFLNQSSSAVDDQYIVVKSGGCTKCKKDDTYRLRAYETTYVVPRFNNTGSQITVLTIQNPTAGTVNGQLRFWDPAGTLTFSRAVELGPKELFVYTTATDVPDASGSITMANDARWGELHGKAVGLEPATGFSFDTLLEPRPRD
jgi:hypothetical protein